MCRYSALCLLCKGLFSVFPLSLGRVPSTGYLWWERAPLPKVTQVQRSTHWEPIQDWSRPWRWCLWAASDVCGAQVNSETHVVTSPSSVSPGSDPNLSHLDGAAYLCLTWTVSFPKHQQKPPDPPNPKMTSLLFSFIVLLKMTKIQPLFKSSSIFHQ